MTPKVLESDKLHEESRIGDRMTDWKRELHRTWTLQRNTPNDGVVHAHVLATNGGRPLRVFTEHGGTRHLLVPGNPGATLEAVAGDALTCEVRTLSFEGTPELFLDISCSQPALFEVFDDLLASTINDAVGSADPLAAAADVLTRWRELLRAWSASLVREREMGLFAELHSLDIVTARTGTFDPLSWKGPDREPKDVVLTSAWVEVKAVGSTSKNVWINGLEQLADLEGRVGFLAVITVVEHDSGETVADVAGRLRPRTKDPTRFDELLLKAGWTHRTDGRRWIVEGVDVINATVCPRVTSANPEPLPAGVGRFRYELDLSIVRSHAVRGGANVLSTLGGDQ